MNEKTKEQFNRALDLIKKGNSPNENDSKMTKEVWSKLMKKRNENISYIKNALEENRKNGKQK